MAIAPNFDTGFAAVAGVEANPPNADSVTSYWLMGANFTNDNDGDVFIGLFDGAGKSIMGDVRVAGHDSKVIEWPFMPIVGLQWQVGGAPGGAGVTGKIWGYNSWPF